MGKTMIDHWICGYLILREIQVSSCGCLNILRSKPNPDAEFAIDSQSKSSQQYTEVAGGDNMELQ